MGQIGSSVSKILRPPHKGRECDSQRHDQNEFAITPYVYTRRGSMYYDEDGDLAHEFYEETRTPKGIKMKKKSFDKLRPQGLVKMKIPRINKDIAIVLHEVQS